MAERREQDFFDIIDEESFIRTIRMYRFLMPLLWFEHITYHCIMDRGYDFLNKYVDETVFERAHIPYKIEDERKAFEWCSTRLSNSSCTCAVCKQ